MYGCCGCQVERFRAMLTDEQFLLRNSPGSERGVSRLFGKPSFEENPWIFGYGLNLISAEALDEEKLEQITTGSSVFGGAGKRSDAVLRMRGVISSSACSRGGRHRGPQRTNTTTGCVAPG